MSGSMDDREVHVVNAGEETILTVLVYPDGKTVVLSDHPGDVIAYMLRQLADTFTPDPAMQLTADQVEETRTQVDAMIKELEDGDEPATTETLVAILGDQRRLSADEHRLMLATTAAVLFQRVVYA